MGPVIVTTIGILFLLSEVRGGYFGIGHTYPVLFMVIGAMLLGSAVAPMDGHIESPTAPPPPAVPPPTVAPPSYSGSSVGPGQ
jgi:hypothetical protein